MALFSRTPKGPKRPGRKDFEKSPPATRAIVFYAENGDTWPHYEPIVQALRADGRELSYLTSSPDDPIFDRADPGIHSFEIGEGVGRSFCFQTMETGVVVASLPQLGSALLPKSRRAPALGTQYVHVFHSMVSTHMIYEPDAYDHYDTVLCVGPYMVDEIRKREELARTPAKELLPHGYGRLDSILEQAGARSTAPAPAPAGGPPVVLVAPSWGPTCLFETCGVELVTTLLDAGFEVIARPHPMTRKRSPQAYDDLVRRLEGRERCTLDTDISSQAALQRADVMISDWSGAALEYAFGLGRPVVYMDVPRKVNNPEYERIGIEPFEASVRERIGFVASPSDLAALPALVGDACERARAGEMRDRIAAVRDECVYNVGSSGRAAADVVAAKADAYLARAGAGR